MENGYKLTIEIKNTEPVELIDLTNSLLSLGDEYKRFLTFRDGPAAAEEVNLYIKEIRTGSIITDLIAIAPGALPIFNHAVTVIDFSNFLKRVFEFFIKGGKKEPRLDKRSYENLSNFLEPVAKDGGSQLNCHTTVNGDVNVTVNINANDANALQNKFRKKIELLKEPITGLKEKVVLYWYQARNDPKSQAGDRAIIESISKGPVKAIIEASMKDEMLSGPENPFQSAYLVDVEVETVNGNPKVYKIVNLHEKYSKD